MTVSQFNRKIDSSIRYIGNVSNVESDSIVLDKGNVVSAKLPDSHDIIILIDSWAFDSLICSSKVNDSPYLSKLPRREVKEIKLKLVMGNILQPIVLLMLKSPSRATSLL